MSETELAGSRILLTGASSGIGAVTARLLAKVGATVGLVGRRSDLLASVLEDCKLHAPESRMWVTDLGDLEGAERLADEAWDALGRIDVLINNAAVPKVRAVTALSPEDIEHAMRVNFLAPARMTMRVLPRMLAGDGGTIVNVASMGGRLGIAHEAAYCASKFAFCGWSEAIAIDLHGSNVKVRLVQPGPIDTDIWDRPGEEPAVYQGPKLPPEIVAEGIVACLSSDRFEHYFPDLKAVVTNKDADLDAYIAGVASMITKPSQAGTSSV